MSEKFNLKLLPTANKALIPLPFLVGFIICICCHGASAVCVTKEGPSLNQSAQPLELGGCVNFRCPDNYECNSAYKCCNPRKQSQIYHRFDLLGLCLASHS
uniref:GRANULINS domain-containing protein n=1 Tax=Globodera pallida TaxID=36090 RepID=A0A183CJF8_GLOPA